MLYLIRFSGEIATKSRGTRRRFQQQLAHNIRAGLASARIDATLETAWSRFYLRSDDSRAGDVLSRIFGIRSFSPVEARSLKVLADVVAAGESIFGEIVAGTEFAVRARVTQGRGDPWDFGARDIERDLGTALLPYSVGVNLSNPGVTVRAELRDDTAYFFSEIIEGPGGLPLGVQDRAVALVSGGFDSAVAAWYVMRRGVRLDLVLCNLGGDPHRETAGRVIDALVEGWSHGVESRLHIVDFADIVVELRDKVPERFIQVVLKRQMLRVAGAVADEVGGSAIVMGDAIGQVASQTTKNLHAMMGAADYPILRPLIGMDKDEIVAASVRVGTHDLSAKVEEHCAIVPRYPSTGARREMIDSVEEALDSRLVSRALATRTVIDLPRRAETEADHVPIEMGAVPEDGIVIDVRSQASYDAWHFPGAVHAEFPGVLARLDGFEPGRPYVAYCPFGAKSSLVAEALRRRGIEAYSFAGGTRGLMEWAHRQGLDTPLALELA